MLTRALHARRAGPSHVNVVLNGGPGCCCCGPTPIHAASVTQRMGGAVGLMGAIAHVQGPMETIHFNTWAGNGIPQPLMGRVDPSAWVNFINAVSQLEMAQPGCCAQVFLCKCCSSGAEFNAALQQIEAAWAQPLGAVAMSKRQYNYQVWVPATSGTPGSDGNPGSPPEPAHWENRSMDYLRIDLAAPCPQMMAPGMMMQPGMPMQPGMVQMNPMMAPQQQAQYM